MARDRKGHPPAAEEDLKLWQGIAKTTKPLRGRKDLPPDAAAKAEADEKGEDAAAKPPPRPRSLPRREAARAEAAPLPLSAGAGAGVDRRTADRLKRGKLPIEGRLDLHGMTQAEAQRAVSDFIAGGARAGRRCLLVITGKGSGREGGVLRQSLPGWLNEPVNRARLVAFTPAQPQHGGHGAIYLLLKRTRD